ncbi:hypothetical protein Tco_0630916 [Tanacetum coccineum]
MLRAAWDRKSTTEVVNSWVLYLILLGKAKKSVKLMMEKLFRMELELMLGGSTLTMGKYVTCPLVDGKKIIINESTVRRDHQLEDAEGVDCLPNSTIFEQLALIPKTTAWNEFSSTMASAIICLATNQKFNFSKYIFESMVRNLDNLSGKFLMYLRKPKRKDTRVPQPSGPIDNVADKAVYEELGDSLVRAATTASSLEVEQDSGNITKTQSKATPNESSSLGTTSGGGPRCQETMGDTIAQTRFENVSKHSNDSLLARVLDLEKTKTTQGNEIASLKRRVKKLEKKNRGGLMLLIVGIKRLIDDLEVTSTKFNSIKDSKLLLEAIEKRFGGNAATKKTQKNLLKQQYKNFTSSSSETLDQTFDRLQKLVSQLEILGETLSQEDVNLMLFRSLSSEWNTHAVVWRNKPELETMRMDDLYNNLKVYETEVKGTSSSSISTQNMAFVSSNNSGSTNEAVNTAHGVFAASNAANLINIDNSCDLCILF